jgi:hypothetical protein
MRINLSCPFAEKDQAKALGAKWDAAKRVWYIVDVENLTPFMRWMPSSKPREQPVRPVKLTEAMEREVEEKLRKMFAEHMRKHGTKPHKPAKDRHATVTTGTYKPICNCTTPPWEDCEHTEELASRSMSEMLA